jgi:hypothetical protein
MRGLFLTQSHPQTGMITPAANEFLPASLNYKFSSMTSQEITPLFKEKLELVTLVASSFDAFSHMIGSFTNEQLTRIPFEGSWTAAQVATHIIMATDGLPDNRTENTNRDYKAQIENIQRLWLDNTAKYQSPEFLVPVDPIPTKEQILAELDRIKNKNITIVHEKDLTDSCMDFAIPTFGYLTRYEWLVFIALHVVRHTRQLQNIHSRVQNQF